MGYRLWGRKESDMTEQLLLKYACVYSYMYWAGQKSLWIFPQDVIEKYEQTFWPTQYKYIHIYIYIYIYIYKV